MPEILLKPERDESLKRKHPWIFSGAVAKVVGGPASGETVEVRGKGGPFLRPRGLFALLADPGAYVDVHG